jgi:hypothetical protein
MNLRVLPEMVRSHELLASLISSMRSISIVYLHMSSKLIRTKERPHAAFPTASTGLLPCVFALVTHVVRALGICLSTVIIHAEVWGLDADDCILGALSWALEFSALCGAGMGCSH